MQKSSILLPEQVNTAVALGFFDGVHKGHRRVISQAVMQSKNGLTPVCFTFEQSPKSVLTGAPEIALMTAADKQITLKMLGIEHTLSVDFKSVMQMSAGDFVAQILKNKLSAKYAVCGFNYRFGKNGEGDSSLLKSLCAQNGIEVCVIPPEKCGNDIVSSTLIRELIANGDVQRANELMCSHFGFCSVIEHGKRLGRKLGTPTINQPLCENLAVPRFGVYASAVTLEDGSVYCGVTNIGIKPTVGGTKPLCETWMPDYKGGEIYGETADIRLLSFVRDEKKFKNIDELKDAILENAETAKQIFGTLY